MSLTIGPLQVVSAVFALGREMEAQRRAHLRTHPIQFLYPAYEGTRNPSAVAIMEINRPELFGPQGAHPLVRQRFADLLHFQDGVFVQRAPQPGEADDPAYLARLSDFVDAVLEASPNWQDREHEARKRRYDVEILKSWTSASEERRGRNAIIVSLAQTAFAFLDYKADALGLDAKAERIVGAFAQGVNTYLTTHRDTIVETAFSEGAPKRILDLVLTTTLRIASDRPDLFSGEEHVQAMIGAVIDPLREANDAPAGDVSRLERFRAAIRGPVMVNMLETLHANRASVFGDDYPKTGTAVNAVTEALFGALVGNAREHGGLHDIIRPGLFQRTYPVLMQAVIDQPNAFVRGTGDHVELGRELLSSWAGVFRSRPNIDADGELAGRLFELSVDITRRHARQYLAREGRARLNAWTAERRTELAAEGRADDPWALVSLRLVTHVADKMLSSVAAGGLASGDVFAQVDFDLFLELVGILAEQAAETPGMILPEDVNPELVTIAQGVARFISDKHASLLSRADWRRVSAKAIELAMANPAVLFSIDESRPEGHLAVSLVQQILATAHGDLSGAGGAQARGPGRVLFGATLASAIETVLERAVANARQLLNRDVQGAVVVLAARLNKLSERLAQEQGAGLSAGDWLDAFRWFLAHVVETGDGHIPDDRLLAFVESRGASEQAPPSALLPAAAPSPAAPAPASLSPASAPAPIADTSPARVFHNPVPPEEALG